MAQRLTPSIGQSGGSGLVDPIKANRPYLVDTYERPGPSPLAGLAESLGQFNRSLSGAFNASMAGRDQENANEEAKGRLAVAQAGSFSEAQRRGLIPANANPFFMAGANDYEGRARAYQAHLEIQKQFQNDPIKNEVDTAKQAEWVQAQFDQRLQGMDNDYTRAGFLRTIGPMRQQLLGEFGKQAEVNAKTRMWAGAGEEIDGVVAVNRVTGGLDSVLAGRESGGDYARVNPIGFAGKYQVGAPLLADVGLYIPAPDENIRDPKAEGKWSGNKWGGQFNIPGYPGVKTMADFLANKGAQEKAYQMSKEHNWKTLENLGLAKAVGTVIDGIPVTRDGLLAATWLAGPAGVRAWIESNGKENRPDRNNTTVSDYMALGARTSGVTDSVTPAPTNILAVRDSLEQLRHKLYHTQGQTGAEIDQFIADKLIAMAIQTRDVSLLDLLRMGRRDLLDPSKPFPSYASNPKVAAAVASAEQTIKSRLEHDADRAHTLRTRQAEQEMKELRSKAIGQIMRGEAVDPQDNARLMQLHPSWAAERKGVEQSLQGTMSVRDFYGTKRQIVQAALQGADPTKVVEDLAVSGAAVAPEQVSQLMTFATDMRDNGPPGMKVFKEEFALLKGTQVDKGVISVFQNQNVQTWVLDRYTERAYELLRDPKAPTGLPLREALKKIRNDVLAELPQHFPDNALTTVTGVRFDPGAYAGKPSTETPQGSTESQPKPGKGIGGSASTPAIELGDPLVQKMRNFPNNRRYQDEWNRRSPNESWDQYRSRNRIQ